MGGAFAFKQTISYPIPKYLRTGIRQESRHFWYAVKQIPKPIPLASPIRKQWDQKNMTVNKFLNDALKICYVVSNLLFRDFHFCLFSFMRLLKLCARVLH